MERDIILMLRKTRKYESEEKIKERFVKYRKGKKLRKDTLYKASKEKGQKKLISFARRKKIKV